MASPLWAEFKKIIPPFEFSLSLSLNFSVLPSGLRPFFSRFRRAASSHEFWDCTLYPRILKRTETCTNSRAYLLLFPFPAISFSRVRPLAMGHRRKFSTRFVSGCWKTIFVSIEVVRTSWRVSFFTRLWNKDGDMMEKEKRMPSKRDDDVVRKIESEEWKLY